MSKISVRKSLHSGAALFDSITRLRGRMGIYSILKDVSFSHRLRQSQIDSSLFCVRHCIREGLVTGGGILFPHILKIFSRSVYSLLSHSL